MRVWNPCQLCGSEHESTLVEDPNRKNRNGYRLSFVICDSCVDTVLRRFPLRISKLNELAQVAVPDE